MADGPLTAGLLGGLNIRRQREADQLRKQQIANQQALQEKQFVLQEKKVAQDKAQQDFENTNTLLDFAASQGNVPAMQVQLDKLSDSLVQSGALSEGASFNSSSVLDNLKDFQKRRDDITEFMKQAGNDPERLQAGVAEIKRIQSDFGGIPALEKGVEAVGGLAPEEVETITSEKLIDDPESPSGMSVALLDKQGNLVKKLRNATDKDITGKALVQVNTGDLQKGTVGKLEDQIIAGQKTIGQLNRAEATFKPEFLTIAGKAKGAIQRLSEKAGFETDTDFLKEKSRWFNQAKQAFFVYRKWVTGVAGGEKEMKDIAKAFADPERNSPSEYLANLQETRLWTRAVDKWLRETKALGLSISETREILPEVGVGGEFEAEGVSPEDEANAFLEGL